MPTRHDAVIAAYTASADAALTVVALIVLLAGALVIIEMAWVARRTEARSGRLSARNDLCG